jgi:serine-type D-Ala-D-Ala carboxypeptidase/endopeptidase (penicillin-binding protein 4)
MRRRHLLLPLPLVLATICPADAADSLEARVEAVLHTPGYQNAHWGLLVVDSMTGKVVFEKNADQMFGPASVTKIYSTATALVDLGPGYRFRTPVVRKGNVDAEGVLHGNLILVASGDLCLGGRTGPNDTLLFEDNDHIYANGNNSATLVPANPLAGLEHLAKGISESGIKRVDGDVLIDDRLFEPAPSTGSGPSRVSPIVVNDNVIDVVVTPALKVGAKATVRLVPETSFVSVDALVDTVDEGEKPSISIHSAGFRAFTVRGKVPLGHKPVVRIYEVDDPASFARALFIETLRKRGVMVGASPLAHNATDRLPTRGEVSLLPQVASYVSPPFSEYAKVILKVSHNLHASTQPLLIAAHHGETNLHEGLRRQGKILRELGIDISTIAFGGGAGGAREDLVTPRATVALLRALARRAEYPAFEAALPVLGKDGTLAKAVGPDSSARGHARAKTGTYWVDNALNGQSVITSKALAGTIDAADGRKLTVAFFLNNIPAEGTGVAVSEATAAAGRVLGRLCEVFYESSGETPPTQVGGSPR